MRDASATAGKGLSASMGSRRKLNFILLFRLVSYLHAAASTRFLPDLFTGSVRGVRCGRLSYDWRCNFGFTAIEPR